MKFWNEKFETMPRAEMVKYQNWKLAETVRWVYEKVPFYRNALDAKGLKPEDIKSVEDIKHLPFTVKTDLRDNYPFGLCAVPMKDLARVHASSGTTGKPITGPYTKEDESQWGECMARALWAASVRPDDVVQISYGMGLFTGGLGFLIGAQTLGCCIVPSGSGMTERQLLLMQDFKVDALFCTPTYALTIVERAEQLGIDMKSFPLRAGCFGAEPWTVEMREDIERRMGIKAYEAYGLTEMMGPGVGFSCEHYNIHINEDHIYPEIINPDTLEPLPYGEKGELVFTAIQRRAMPLLRYRTRDITSLREVECGCGRKLVVMDKILGRSDDMVIISGVNVFPSQIESQILEIGSLEPQYLLRVSKKGYLDRLAVEVEAKPDVYAGGAESMARVAKKLESRIHNVIGITVPVTIVPSGTIARSEGKAKRVIDERKLG